MNTRDNLTPSAADWPSAPLQQALRLAALDLDQQHPPPALAASVRLAVHEALATTATATAGKADGVQPVANAPARVGARAPAWSAALACAAVVVLSVVLMVRSPWVQPQQQLAVMAGFVPVVPQEQWPTDDTPAWLVHTELQANRLAALGLPFDPARAGDGVRAELLVRASGQVLAVRFIE